MGAFVRNVELYTKLSNEVQHNFGKLQPIGKFLNDNAKIILEVLNEQTIRVVYRSMVYYPSNQMLPIINEVEHKNAIKATEDIKQRLEEKLDVKLTIREELENEIFQYVMKEPETNEQRGFYRWSTIIDVEQKK